MSGTPIDPDHAGGRARRVIVVLAPSLVIAYALLSILERRSLHADGSWAFVQSLMSGGYWIGDAYRLVADMIAETPLSVLAMIGVTDRGVLTVAHGVGYILVPSLAWAAAMWISRSSIVFEFILLGYCATALTSGFLAIGEYNSLFAFVALCFAATMAFWAGQRRLLAWTVVASSMVVLSSHGLALLLAPLLLVALVLPMRRLGRPTVGGVPVILASAILLAGTVAGGLAVVFPYRSGNVRRASDLVSPLVDNHQLQFLIIVLALLAVSVLARQPWLRRVAAVVLVVGLVVLVVGWPLWATPYEQHASRTWSAVLLFVILAECLVACWSTLVNGEGLPRPVDGQPSGRMCTLAFAIFVALLIPASIQTIQFGSFARSFEDYVNSRTGLIPNGQFVRDVPSAERYGWPATFPSLSLALRNAPDRAIISNPADTIWTPPFDEREPPVIPSKYWSQKPHSA